MKGLIIKDLYMTLKYCRANIIMALIFALLSLTSSESLFIVFYSSLLCGMIPINLLAYDERSRWLQYSETMPYSRAQIVSGKYIIGLLAQASILILIGVTHAVAMISDGTFEIGAFASFIMLLLTLSLISSSISMPFIFKFGVEKGRLAYYFMVGVVFAGSISSSILIQDSSSEVNLNMILPAVCIVGIAIFALSWLLSIVFYRKREL